MSITFQIKKGLDSKLKNVTGKAGEPLFTTDTGRFFVSDGDKNIEYSKKEDLDNIANNVNGMNFDNEEITNSINVALDDTVINQSYLGGYIEIQPDSWDGTSAPTDESTKTWGFPYSLLPSERAKVKSELLNGKGTNIMYIRFPLGFSYRGYRNIDTTTNLAKNIGERFTGQNESLKSWFDQISLAGGGLAAEYWCPAPYWVTSGSYSGTNQLRAGGSYSMATTLSSIKSSDATQYNAQINAFTDAIINDLEYLHQNVAPVRMFGLQNEPQYSQEAYGACKYDAQTYNDVLESLYPKLSASKILSVYNGEANIIKIHAGSSDESNPFAGILSTFINNHPNWIWGYSHHSMRYASGEEYLYGADWYKTTDFANIKGSKPNVFINEYEYFTVNYGTDDFRCSNNMLRLINEAVYGEAQVFHPVIHICKPLGQTNYTTNTRGYCLYTANLVAPYGLDTTDANNTLGLNKGCVSPNLSMYNSWSLFGDNLPVGAYLVGSYSSKIDRAGYCVYKYNGKLYVFLANNSDKTVAISITFNSSKLFNGKMYSMNYCGDKISSKQGTTIEFVIPAYSGQCWIEESVLQQISTPSTVVASDTFTRADNTTLGNTETGQSWSIVQTATSNATFGISNNHAYYTTQDIAIAYVDAGVPDCAISCDITHGGYSSIAFRITDIQNHYRIRFSSGGFGLFKIANNVSTSIANFSITPAIGTVYNLKVVLKGSSIKCYIGDLLIIDATDSTFVTQTKHGLYSSKSTTDTWDNFKITT